MGFHRSLFIRKISQTQYVAELQYGELTEIELFRYEPIKQSSCWYRAQFNAVMLANEPSEVHDRIYVTLEEVALLSLLVPLVQFNAVDDGFRKICILERPFIEEAWQVVQRCFECSVCK